MKTNLNISALSIMLLFATVTLFAGNSGISTKTPPNSVIVHQVNISDLPDKAVCGSYVIEVRDQAGKLVAPAQSLIPGKNRYIFFEKSDLSNGEGTRTAMMLQVTGHGTSQCSWVLNAEPVTLKAIFQPGNLYNYQLTLKPVRVIKN